MYRFWAYAWPRISRYMLPGLRVIVGGRSKGRALFNLRADQPSFAQTKEHVESDDSEERSDHDGRQSNSVPRHPARITEHPTSGNAPAEIKTNPNDTKVTPERANPAQAQWRRPAKR